MRAIGFTCGIGSMLVGARQAGFDIIGNVEWRKYYHKADEEGKNTFIENFPGAYLVKNEEDLTEEQKKELYGIDLAMGHPECGNFSNLSCTAQFKKSFAEMNKDCGDIPIFVNLVRKYKPRFFIQDNLPKSLIGYPMHLWAEALPEYDLFPEWISNWGYGNIQKFRNRFFMIGALKEEHYVFKPGEKQNTITTRELLKNLPKTNHDEHTLVGNTAKGRGVYTEDRHMNWAEYKKYMLQAKDGETLPYKSKDGTWKKHIGHRKGFKDGYVPVITGGCPIANPFTGLPFSMRERCRIQGLPDDFILYGTIYEDDGTWSHYRNMALVKQTGKCMPVQFCYYVSQQIADHINGKIEPYDPKKHTRILNPNIEVEKAKKWYCDTVGYTNQDGACDFCKGKPCK